MLRHASEAVSDEAGSAAADASGRLYQIKADKHRSHRAEQGFVFKTEFDISINADPPPMDMEDNDE